MIKLIKTKNIAPELDRRYVEYEAQNKDKYPCIFCKNGLRCVFGNIPKIIKIYKRNPKKKGAKTIKAYSSAISFNSETMDLTFYINEVDPSLAGRIIYAMADKQI